MKTSCFKIYLLCFFLAILIMNCEKKKDSDIVQVTDTDGNVYGTVTIGTQVWMAENLKTTQYNDGLGIPLVTDNGAWKSINTPAYCWYDNNKTNYKDTYGALYNWYAVETDKLCPEGWHVPSNDEWETLMDYLGGSGVAGGKLKEAGFEHWDAPNTDATNESAFTALPGGARQYSEGIFMEMGLTGAWWSASEVSEEIALLRAIEYDDGYTMEAAVDKRTGASVRCLKD